MCIMLYAYTYMYILIHIHKGSCRRNNWTHWNVDVSGILSVARGKSNTLQTCLPVNNALFWFCTSVIFYQVKNLKLPLFDWSIHPMLLWSLIWKIGNKTNDHSLYTYMSYIDYLKVLQLLWFLKIPKDYIKHQYCVSWTLAPTGLNMLICI